MRRRVLTGSFSTGIPVAARTSSICPISLSALVLRVFMSNVQCCLYRTRAAATDKLRLVHVGLSERVPYRKRQFVRQQRRDGVAYLRELLHLVPAELESVWETLNPRRLANGDPAPSPIGKAHPLHVAGRSGEIAACDGTGRHVWIQVPRSGAMRLPLVFGYVRILFGREDLRSVRYCLHGVADCIADRCDMLFTFGEPK